MKIENISTKLTWHDAEGVDLSKVEGFGLLLRDKKGIVYEVGEYVMGAFFDHVRYTCVYDSGCGCCSNDLTYTEYAFLSEYVEALEAL